MADRASVFEAAQIGVEATPGTAVAALKRLLCTSIIATPNTPANKFRPQGSKADTDVIRRKDHTEAQIEGVLSFYDICYLASGLLCAATITTPGGATSARDWEFLPKTFGPDDFKTFTVETGSSAGAEKFAYGFLNGLSFRFSEEEAGLTGSMMGKRLTDDAQRSTNEVQRVTLAGATGGTFTLSFGGQSTAGIAYNAAASAVQSALEALSTIGAGSVKVSGSAGGPYDVEFRGRHAQTNVALMTSNATGLTGTTPSVTLTEQTPGAAPTDVTKMPVSPARVSVYAADTYAGLSAGKLTRLIEMEAGIQNRFTARKTLDADETSFSTVLERAPENSAQIVIHHDSVAVGYMSDLRAARQKFLRVSCFGDEIEPGFSHQIDIEMPFKFLENSRGDNDDAWASTFTIAPVYESGFGGWLRLKVRNGLAAL
jgi:hypothetical protein